MPLILADRVRDTTTTTGTGTVTLSGTAPTGYQNFSVIGNGNTTYYTINAGSQWEVGIGTYSSTGPTLARNTVLESSNANALVNFAAGTKDVFVTYPSDEAVYQDGAVIAAGTAVLGVANGGTGVTSSTGSVSVVLSKSPTLETPILGAATATSIANGLGAVGTPSYTFTGDLNTGMWSPAADTIAFSEGGVEIMRINSAGNVGIGTTSPQQLLAVGNSTDQVGAGVSGAVTTLFFGTPSNMTGGIKRIAYDRTTGSMNFIGGSVASPSTQMSLDTNGNLGIGTSAPAQTLQVVNAGNYQFRLGAGSTFNYDLGRSGSDGLLYFYGNQSTFTGYVFGGVDGERMRIDSSGNLLVGSSASPSGSGTNLQVSSSVAARLWLTATGNRNFYFESSSGNALQIVDATAGAERMRIDSSGRVGVGTSAPQQIFQVTTVGQSIDGPFFSSSTGPWMRFIPNSSPGAYNGIVATGTNSFIFSGGSANTGSLTIAPWADGTSGVVINASGSVGIGANLPGATGISPFLAIGANNAGIGSASANNIVVVTNNAERMRINSSGEVYIAGTADQGAFNLQVNGTGVWGAGAYVNGSDRSLKEDIAPLAEALDVINALKPVTFRYKKDYSKDQSIQPGFIAQELQEALGGEVYVDGVVQAGPEHLNVAYQSLIPVLVKAIQELTARVAQLEGN